MSTNSTGYAIFKDNKLIKYGIIKPKVPSLSKLVNPEANIRKCESICYQISQIVDTHNINVIVVEQVNLRGIAGLIQQKNLCILHGVFEFIFIDKINDIIYINTSDWRKTLGISVKKEQKAIYNELRKKDKKLPGDYKIATVDKINELFGGNFKYDEHDICDAIGVANHILTKKC